MMNPHSNDPCSAPLSRTQDKDYMAGLIGDYSSLPSSTYVPSSTGQGWGTKLNQLPCGYSIDQNATSGDTAFGSTSDPLMDNSLIQTVCAPKVWRRTQADSLEFP
ncbi:hypothetical protein BJY04DRAFT_182600 [Aspergillus karnatakaensis]|uniref:uncharacterized protein n=1 Tax=Aspergillus karnatakaensis TaxID=1810916 RepID=UPI003CCCB7F1